MVLEYCGFKYYGLTIAKGLKKPYLTISKCKH